MLLVWGATASAAGQEHFEVPAHCGSVGELRRKLDGLLGNEAAQAWPRRMRIVLEDEGTYRLTLVLPEDTRTLRDTDCRTLFKTAIVVAAATVEPTSEASDAPAGPVTARDDDAPKQSSPEARALTAPPISSEAEALSRPPSATRAREDAEWRLGFGLAGGVLAGFQPGATPWAQLSATLAWDRVGVALAARYLAPGTHEKESGHAVTIRGWGLQLASLYDPVPWLRLLAGMGLDRLTGEGQGEVFDAASGVAWAFSLGVEAMWVPLRWQGLRLSCGVTGHYALVRPSFRIAGYGELYRVPRVAAGGVVRVAWELQ